MTAHTAGKAPIHQLPIENTFKCLTKKEQLYAHHLSRAVWHGSRVILRQTSPEAVDIFDFILEVYRSCGGDWTSLPGRLEITSREVDAFLEYAALFLQNLGNFYGEGDQKFIPDLSETAWQKISAISEPAQTLSKKIGLAIFSVPPYGLGYPSDTTLSAYYPGSERITQDEINTVAKVLGTHGIEPENTRIRKITVDGKPAYDVLQASIESDDKPTSLVSDSTQPQVRLVRGDHAAELEKICASLSEAKKYASNEKQVRTLEKLIESFTTGDLAAYRDAQKAWVTDISPRVENIFGFVEPLRDPSGVRAEWESVLGISDPVEGAQLKEFVDKSTVFIRELPWAVKDVNDGKGPFERSLFEAPDFTSMHALALCSSNTWEAANLPNYNDIRENLGSKNIVIANRLSANNDPDSPCHFIHPSEVDAYKSCSYLVRFVETAIHELIGHGTGKLLSEVSPGKYNFNKENPPINPLTGKPITSWYKHGQTWGTVFQEIGTTVEECRAMLMSLYLVDNKELLSIFGYNDESTPNAGEFIYYTYLYFAHQGLVALTSYNTHTNAWGNAHKQANFTIFRHLLTSGNGVLRVEHNAPTKALYVHIDRSLIPTAGKHCIGQYLTKLHIWRCTADKKACEAYYDELSKVEGQYKQWLEIVHSKPTPRWKFAQVNTVLKEDGEVDIRSYEGSDEGVVRSWAERGV